MGKGQSTLEKKGYKIEAKTERGLVATKDNEKFLVKKLEISNDGTLVSTIETLSETSHPHIASTKNSFEDDDGKYLMVMEYCQGGSLAEKIHFHESPEEYKPLSWIAEICMALEFLHGKEIPREAVTPAKIYFTEAGTLRLGAFGEKAPSSDITALDGPGSDAINYMAPELFIQGTYDARSQIWSLGCILHEAYSHKKAFSAESITELRPKIISGGYSSLPAQCSEEFCELLKQMLKRNPDERPTASEILEKPIMIRCLSQKSKKMTKHLQSQLMALRGVAESLEHVHKGTTIGSLTGGVIGAAAGIACIVGLALAPFTLGASLWLTGVGVGVGVAGGVTAGASNIIKTLNETSDRKAVRSIIQDFDEKIKAVALWLQVICNGLERLSTTCDEATGLDRGLSGFAHLRHILKVVNHGHMAVQTFKAGDMAMAATGVLFGLLLAVDVFFIALDAKEIHRIRNKDTCSEVLKFVQTIRSAADELQEVLDVFGEITENLPGLEE